MKKRTKLAKWMIRTLVKLAIALVAVTAVQVWTLKYINPPVTVNMVYEWILGNYFNHPYVRPVYAWKDLEQISPHLRRAVLASEDQRFLTHHGFDLHEMQNVVEGMLDGQGFRGASTITMQASRSLFLPASRSILRKLAEAWYTIWMELLWDKARILEIYLNTVDWGTGLVGAQAAARHNFNTHAGRLTPSQAALLAAVLPSPHKWSAKTPSDYIKTRQKWIMSQMPAMPAI